MRMIEKLNITKDLILALNEKKWEGILEISSYGKECPKELINLVRVFE